MSSHVLGRRRPAHARKKSTSSRVLLAFLWAAVVVSAIGLAYALISANIDEQNTRDFQGTDTSITVPSTTAYPDTAPAVVESQSLTSTSVAPKSRSTTSVPSSVQATTTATSIVVGDGTEITTTTTAPPNVTIN